jgi:hypothetical protein
MNNKNQNSQESGPVRLPITQINGKSYFVDSRLKQYRNVENPHDFINFEENAVIYTYTRTQAIEDGVLVDVSPLAVKAGFKVPVAVTQGVIGLLNDTTQSGQSFEGRAWDMFMILRFESRKFRNPDTVYFAPLFNAKDCAQPKPHKLWAKVGPGDEGEPVITIMLIDED